MALRTDKYSWYKVTNTHQRQMSCWWSWLWRWILNSWHNHCTV